MGSLSIRIDKESNHFFQSLQTWVLIMPVKEVEWTLPETRRREAFRLLVTGQDLEMTVSKSRQMVMEICGLLEVQVIQIEREGIAGRWPPL